MDDDPLLTALLACVAQDVQLEATLQRWADKQARLLTALLEHMQQEDAAPMRAWLNTDTHRRTAWKR